MNEIYYMNSDLGIAGVVSKQKNGLYAVWLEDLDVKQRLHVASTNLPLEQAIIKAKQIANLTEE